MKSVAHSILPSKYIMNSLIEDSQSTPIANSATVIPFPRKPLPAVASLTNEALMDLVAAQNEAALREIIERNRNFAMAIAYRIVRNHSRAEDIVQDAFIRIWTRSNQWQNYEGSRFLAWFARIVTNLSIDYSRKRVHSSIDDMVEIVDGSLDARALAEGKEIGLRIADALAKLPQRQREAFVLCQIEGTSNAEAAEILGTSVGALELLLVRARKSMRIALNDLMQ